MRACGRVATWRVEGRRTVRVVCGGSCELLSDLVEVAEKRLTRCRMNASGFWLKKVSFLIITF